MSPRMIIVASLFLVSPLGAQDRIFRATPIDVEQNNRLDVLESRHTVFKAATETRLKALEEKIVEPPVPIKSAPVIAYPPCPITNYVPVGPTILMITNGRCPHCDVWWATYASELKSKGWTVEPEVGEFPEVASFPTFMVFNRKQWLGPFEGKMDMNDLRGLLGLNEAKAVPRIQYNRIEGFVESAPAATSGRYTTEELRQQIRAQRPGGWRGPVYADVAPRSQARQHLIGPEHGFSWGQVAGLSQDEALILHDLAPGHGNKIFPYRTGQQPAVMRADTGCANGECPDQARPSFFRRWRR